MKKIAVIVPAYNEEKSIAIVIDDINSIAKKNNLFLVPIVVNDGSIDATEQIINNLNCIALNLSINLGIGGAVQTGFKYAFYNNFDYAIQVDGDGQHPANQIQLLFNFIEANDADVVIGSRFIDKTGFQSSFLRRVGINYFKWLNSILIGINITDSTSGFRMLNKKALELVVNYYPDEYPEPESIVYFALNNLKIKELAVKMKERNGGISSIQSFTSFYYMLKVTLAIIFTFIRIKFSKK